MSVRAWSVIHLTDASSAIHTASTLSILIGYPFPRHNRNITLNVIPLPCRSSSAVQGWLEALGGGGFMRTCLASARRQYCVGRVQSVGWGRILLCGGTCDTRPPCMPIFYRRGCATTATWSFCLNAIGTPTRTGVGPGFYRSDGALRKNRGSIILHERPHGTDAYMGWTGGGGVTATATGRREKTKTICWMTGALCRLTKTGMSMSTQR